jgi:alkanesulfonate monooxygenase SsuD/methylene tetrahydromethanopterin reductase-like flavin-dependent oxidoreductase (luciferase family)
VSNDLMVYFFTEMPYSDISDEQFAPFPSARVTLPNRLFDPSIAHRLMGEYHDQYVWAEECGFDGLMINEHHSTPTCMDVQINISAGILARTTKRAKILLLGNMLPIWDNPARLAEEIAMVDVLSGGRTICGIVRGIGPESWATNSNPVYNRERFEEAHDVLIECWTTPGPFRWEGKHYQYRTLNPWMLPLQKPHPPIWTPGTGSPATVEWAASRGYTYAAFLTPLDVADKLFSLYREYAEQANRTVGPDNLAFMVNCVVAETDDEAQEVGKAALWRMRHASGGPKEYWAPPGYVPETPFESIGVDTSIYKIGSGSLVKQTYQELQDNAHLVVGSPTTVARKLQEIVERLKIGHLLLEAQMGTLAHGDAMRSIELLGKEVIPSLKRETVGAPSGP